MGRSPTSRSRRLARGIVAALLAGAAGAARGDADLVAALNLARAKGCGGRGGLERTFAPSAKLDEAARLVEQRVPASEALPRAGYRPTRWLTYQVNGALGAPAIAAQVALRSCEQLLDPAYTEVGVHRAGARTSILFAAPVVLPAPGDEAAVAGEVLARVNAARTVARTCGERRFEAAMPLQQNAVLARAARTHAEDMSAKGFVGHDGSDGSTPLIRATRFGYAGRSVGENVAAGQTTAEAVVASWLKSPGHCANLMNPGFAEIGIAYVVNADSAMGVYWAQVFGRPR